MSQTRVAVRTGQSEHKGIFNKAPDETTFTPVMIKFNIILNKTWNISPTTVCVLYTHTVRRLWDLRDKEPPACIKKGALDSLEPEDR